MRPGLWSYVNKIVKDSAVADDIVSTTLTTVYLKIDQYNEAYQITTWAYRIAYNECIGWIRYRNRKVSMNAFTDKGIDPPTFLLPDVETNNELPPAEKDYWEGRVPDELFEEYLEKYGYEYTPNTCQTCCKYALSEVQLVLADPTIGLAPRAPL